MPAGGGVREDVDFCTYVMVNRANVRDAATPKFVRPNDGY
jgi:hypothetical protein